MADRTVGEALDEYIKAGFTAKEIEEEYKKKGVDILKVDPKTPLSSIDKPKATKPAETPFVAPNGDIGPSPFDGVPKAKSTVGTPKPEDPAWYATLGLAKQPDRTPADVSSPFRGQEMTWHPQSMLEGAGKAIAESIEKPERLFTPLAPPESFPTKKSATGTTTVFPSKGPVPGVRPSGKLPDKGLEQPASFLGGAGYPSPAPQTDDSLLKFGNIGKTAEAGQKAKAEEDTKRNKEEHPVMRFLSDLGDMAAGVPQMAYQFLPHPDETESQARERGQQLGKGVAEGLVGGTKQMLEHPWESFKSRPVSTASTAIPAAATAGKLAKLAYADEAGQLAKLKTSKLSSGEMVDEILSKEAASTHGSATGPELLPDLPEMPKERLPSVVDKAADVVHDFIQDQIAPQRSTKALAAVSRWFKNPSSQTTESATAIVDYLVREAGGATESVKKGLTRLFRDALEEGSPVPEHPEGVAVTPAGTTVRSEAGTHVSLPPAEGMPETIYKEPSSPHFTEVENRVMDTLTRWHPEEGPQVFGPNGMKNLGKTLSSLTSGTVKALADHLNPELQGGALLGSDKFVKYLVKEAGRDVNGKRPPWFTKWARDARVALKNAATGEPASFEWQWMDKDGNLNTVDINRYVDKFLRTEEGKNVLEASASSAVDRIAAKVGADIMHTKLDSIANTMVHNMANTDLSTWSSDRWRAFTDDFMALPKGGDKATVLKGFQQILADIHTPESVRKYLPRLMDKIQKFVHDQTVDMDVDPGLASTIRSEIAVQHHGEVWKYLADLNSMISKNLTSRNVPGHLNNFGSNFSMQSMSYGDPFTVAQNLAETIGNWSHYVKNNHGTEWAKLSTADKVLRTLEDIGIAERDMLHDMGQSKNRILAGMDWLYSQGDTIFKLDEASRNMRELLTGLESLKEGDYIQHAVSNGRQLRVTLEKAGEKPVYHIESFDKSGGETGLSRYATAGAQDVAGEQLLFKSLAEMAAKPAFDKFVDFSHMSQAISVLKRYTKAIPLVGAFQPFLSWMMNMIDLPGKPGAMYHTLVAPFNYSTNSPTLLANQAAKYSKIAVQRAMLNNSIQAALHDENTKSELMHLFDFAPTEVKHALLFATISPAYLGVMPLGNYNPMAPSEKAIRVALNAWDSLTRDNKEMFGVTKLEVDQLRERSHGKGSPLTDDDKKRLKYLSMIDSGQLSSLKDVLDLIGLSKTPILSSLDKALDRVSKGESLDASDYNEMFSSALFGGTASRIVDIIAGGLKQTGHPVGFTTRKVVPAGSNDMTEPFDAWTVHRITGLGWNYKNIKDATTNNHSLQVRAKAAESAVGATDKEIKDGILLMKYYKEKGMEESYEVQKTKVNGMMRRQKLCRVDANHFAVELRKTAKTVKLAYSPDLPFPDDPESTDDVPRVENMPDPDSGNVPPAPRLTIEPSE